MVVANQTAWTEFVLVGLSDLPHLRVPLFIGFLLIYLSTVGGNLLVMSIIYSDSHLHTPMYFFLTNLSFVDISYTSILFPKMLVNFFFIDTRITLWECLMQVYFYVAMIAIEFSILTIMSYDRCVAICNPLHYPVTMNRPTCLRLATGAWILGFVAPLLHIIELSKFSFCDNRNINHFVCEFSALLYLSCTSTRTIERMTYILGFIMVICSCLLILISYVKIILTILSIRTTSRRDKAFSTCASHLTVVILFYGVIIFIYFRPTSMYSAHQSKLLFIIYTGVIPLCNPIIYTIKNNEFKDALRRRRSERF